MAADQGSDCVEQVHEACRRRHQRRVARVNGQRAGAVLHRAPGSAAAGRGQARGGQARAARREASWRGPAEAREESQNCRRQDGEQAEAKSNVFWVDIATIHDRFKTIQPWQMINHFPGMPNIARKQRMGQNLNKMQRVFPKEYGFYPRTWILPAEMADFRQQFDNQGNSLNGKFFIIKPDAGCQGKGIFITKTWDNVPQQEMVEAKVEFNIVDINDNDSYNRKI